MSKKIYDLYKNLYLKHGFTAAAVKARNKKQQSLRFKYLLDHLDIKKNDSLLDVGCGLGDLSEYLKKNKIRCSYLGVDFLEHFIESASKKYGNSSKINFLQLDIHQQQLPKTYDWVVLSGLFNDKDHNSDGLMLNLITKMFKASKKGIAFNSLTKYVDYEDKKLFYSNPDKVFKFCVKKLSKYVLINTNYQLKKNTIPFEYTMVVFKK
jgi:2-polyprenyl-3-methyl-5-hydroxy-6-metoxy-1,4-benzoquinol methylase